MDFNSIKNEAAHISKTALSGVGTLVTSSFKAPNTEEETKSLRLKVVISALRVVGALGMGITAMNAITALPALLLTGAVLKMSLIAVGFVLSKDIFQIGENLSNFENSVSQPLTEAFKLEFTNMITQDTYFKNIYRHFMLKA
ncbi:MAG: hypothetical protein H0W88_08280 [Parachlamydiaceae bacterium]|nr:hypothetical protein [Parachlamydiaceae bacterium]